MATLKKDIGLSKIHSERKLGFEYNTGPLKGERFDLETLQELTGVNSNKAMELRGKFLKYNEEIKKRMGDTGHQIPLVLIPKHELRIYRHIKKYDPSTGYLKHVATDGSESLQDAWEKSQLQNANATAMNTMGGLLGADFGGAGIATALGNNKQQTYEADIEYFRVEPKDGSNDFLGIKFEYTYDKEITNFTITFNNERGKNRNRFMSGDVIEFYFDLVDEKQIMRLEKENFHVRKEDIKMDLPLVFTGILEEISSTNSSDSLTIDWSGRNGAYILNSRNINYNYPNTVETLQTGNNTMSYEEIVWNMIVFGTGMVVGEVDLGNRETFYYLGLTGVATQEAAQAQANEFARGGGDNFTLAQETSPKTMDLMEISGNQTMVSTTNEYSNNSRFREGLERVLKRHPFCYTTEPDGTQKVRWSALLEFDLMKPKVFSMAELESGGGGAGFAGDASLAQGLTGSYIYGGESGYEKLPPSVRFKSAWGRDVFAYHYNIMRQNYEKILKSAPIKTETFEGSGLQTRAVLIDQTLLSEVMTNNISLRAKGQGATEGAGAIKNIDARMHLILKYFYTQLLQQIQQDSSVQTADRYDEWCEEVLRVYINNKAGPKGSLFFHNIEENFVSENNPAFVNVLGQANFNRDASTMPLVVQDPTAAPNVGSVLLLPYPRLKEYGYFLANFYPPLGAFSNLGDVNRNEDTTKAPIMEVRTLTQWRLNTDKIRIVIEDHPDSGTRQEGVSNSASNLARLNFYVNVRVIVESSTNPGIDGGLVVVDQRRVPNNLTTIAAILDNSGILSASLRGDAINNPQQIVGIPTTNENNPVGYREGAGAVNMTGESEEAAAKASKQSVTFEAIGVVIECIRKVMDKFFACILYVDEYNIAHIRPRYKMLQFENDPHTPPIWGLYGGQPVYPRLFRSTWKDKLKITPNSVIVIGESTQKASPHMIAKANHGLLQGRFGEYQVVDDHVNDSFNNKFEAYNCAKNKLLSYIRNGYQGNVECDIIPNLRPGHRIDVVDTINGMIGGFIIENIQWHYAKHEGMKMVMNLSSHMLTSDDSYTTTAIASERALSDGFLARNFSGGYETGGADERRTSGFLENLFKQSNIELGKAENRAELQLEDTELEDQMNIYRDRDPLLFDIGDGRTTSNVRAGFEQTPRKSPEDVSAPPEDIPGGRTSGGGGGTGWDTDD